MNRTPIFIDFDERFLPNGAQVLVLRCAELSNRRRFSHKDFSYSIERVEGRVTMRSRANGKGSIRYYSAATVDAAMAHGIKWAQRKVNEAAA